MGKFKKIRFCLGTIIVSLIALPICSADDFDEIDKGLFTFVCILQVVDGLTTMGHLSNSPDNYIMDTWNWKYGTERPSPELMWGVKAIELVGAYYVGKALPPKWRKVFYITVDSLLLFCIQHNLKIGAGFAITF